MAIYIKKNNQLGQTTALMSNKNIKSIYVKQGNEDAVCVWGEGVGQIPFYYPASPECPSIYTVDKIKASTNERETLFTNPQEAGVVLVNPGDTLKIRFYSQWYQNPGSKIKQENQTAYVSKTNSSEEYSFVVQSGQGAVRLETSLGAEKSASCTITAPDKTWGRGIDSFAINVISRKGIASSHTINENKTINLKYGDQVNVANIVYPNEGYNQPTILLNGFTNNRVEGLSLSVSVSRNPKEYSVVKQFTGQNVAWTASNMIGDKVYYDDEISFKVVRKAGYDSPTVNITNGSGGATITTVPHSKDSSVINEINVSLVVKGALVVTVQGGAEVVQTTVTLNVTMTEHINNAKVIVYNIYQNTSRTITVTPGSYEISGRSIVYVEKTSRVTGYKPIYTNNQKSPATGSMTLHISEEAGISVSVTCSEVPSAWNNVVYEKAYIKGGEYGYRDNDEDLTWGATGIAYKGESLSSYGVKTFENSNRRPVLMEINTAGEVYKYYCAQRGNYFNGIYCARSYTTLNGDTSVTAYTQSREKTPEQSVNVDSVVSKTVQSNSSDYVDKVYYEIICLYNDKRNTARRGYVIDSGTDTKTSTYDGQGVLGTTGKAVTLEHSINGSYNRPYAVCKVKIHTTYCHNALCHISLIY